MGSAANLLASPRLFDFITHKSLKIKDDNERV